MKQQSLLTKGLLAVFVMFGSAMPVFAEPYPQTFGHESNVIIDWEDEFAQDLSSTRMATEQKPMTGSKKAMVNLSSTTPVIDWEDEFSYDVPRKMPSKENQVMLEKENAGSWDHEAWQSI